MSVIDTQGPDVLAQVVEAVRLRSRLFCRSELSAPWTIAYPSGTFAHFHVVERGHAWLHLDDSDEPVPLQAGDMALVPHGRGHVLSDGRGAPQVELEALLARTAPGEGRVIRHGGGGEETHLLCGAFEVERAQSHPLLSLLPAIVLVPRQDEPAGPLELVVRLSQEARANRPGADAVVTRLMDVLFVDAIRTTMQRSPDLIGGWLGALHDPQVGAALRALHAAPAQRWTVTSLAAEAGLSRSPFAARFQALVGEPPMAYLTRWRMQMTAQLLRDAHIGIEEAAARVGYSSAAALSRVFKRWYEVSPRHFIRAQRNRFVAKS